MADKRNFIVDDDMKVLEVSIKTIEANRRQIMQKLNIQSFTELAKYTIREGFTTIE